MATCDITPTEPSSTYTLTASFSGDSSTIDPAGLEQLDQLLHGQSRHQLVDLHRTHDGGQRPAGHADGHADDDTTDVGTPLPTKVVTLHHRLGQQSCSGTTDANGNVSCTITAVAQPVSSDADHDQFRW